MMELIFVIPFLVITNGILGIVGVLWYLVLFAAAVAGITMMIIGGFLMVTCGWTGAVMKATGKTYEKELKKQKRKKNSHSASPVINIAVTPNRIESRPHRQNNKHKENL